MEYRCLSGNKVTVQTGISVGSLGKQRKGARVLSAGSIGLIEVQTELNEARKQVIEAHNQRDYYRNLLEEHGISANYNAKDDRKEDNTY